MWPHEVYPAPWFQDLQIPGYSGVYSGSLIILLIIILELYMHADCTKLFSYSNKSQVYIVGGGDLTFLDKGSGMTFLLIITLNYSPLHGEYYNHCSEICKKIIQYYRHHAGI